jgi:hypothetical protein
MYNKKLNRNHTRWLLRIIASEFAPLMLKVIRTEKEYQLTQEKPSFMALVDRWAVIFVIVWSLISLSYGIAFQAIEFAISIPLMTLFMFFMARPMVMAVLYVQAINKSCSLLIYKFFVYFCFTFGVLAFVISVFNAVFMTEKEYVYHMLAASPFPLGAALGASKMYDKKKAHG